MHCPKCGQQQVSEETRFCSRCGFLLTGIAEVVANSGVVPAKKTGLFGSSGSRKRRGVMQGTFMLLLTFLVVPILALISLAFNLEPFLPAIGALLFGIGGILRIIYALMFEAGAADLDTFQQGAFPVAGEQRGAPDLRGEGERRVRLRRGEVEGDPDGRLSRWFAGSLVYWLTG